MVWCREFTAAECDARPQVWGPVAWTTLHMMAANYPERVRPALSLRSAAAIALTSTPCHHLYRRTLDTVICGSAAHRGLPTNQSAPALRPTATSEQQLVFLLALSSLIPLIVGCMLPPTGHTPHDTWRAVVGSPTATTATRA
jgi:hypothetical protein